MCDCSQCTEDMKRANGCTAMPTNRNGSVHTWNYPPGSEQPEAEIDRCPAKILYNATDVMDLYSALNRSGGTIAICDQQELPQPYLDALGVAGQQQAKRTASELKKNQAKVEASGARKRVRRG